ncbi:hypothetical protein ACF0H5_011031 [Mactra antiquata]
MTTFVGIGCMSGSSLDGLDICCVEFTGDRHTDLWSYRLLAAETIPYTNVWTDRLSKAATLMGADLIKLHVDYGHFVGEMVSEFIQKKNLRSVQFVASHGHSVFHQPSEGFTFQLGDGETTSTHLNVPYVCDFRSKDISLGGEGAPLVPCGERFLYTSEHLCVNLGGISNIGIKGHYGYDISPCNILLNRLAKKADDSKSFDKDGEMARSGEVIPDLMQQLNNWSYYKEKPPKSLWRNQIDSDVFSLLENDKANVQDLLRTCTEHIASKIAEACVQAKGLLSSVSVPRILITGGGALNKFLMELITKKLDDAEFEVEKADEDTINFKEALIFAFLGLRCMLGEENVFHDITGSKRDTISGSIHRPMPGANSKTASLLGDR